MGALADLFTVGTIVLNPTAPVVGAFVDRAIGAQRVTEQQRVVQTSATGVGVSHEKALEAAKMRALERVSGTFIVATTRTVDSTQNSSIVEYSGGSIRSFDITNVTVDNGLYSVTITANVVLGKNNTASAPSFEHRMSGELKHIQQEQQRQSAFVAEAFGNQPMYQAAVTGVTYQATTRYVELSIGTHIVWSPKFVDDVKHYVHSAGKRVEVGDKSSMYAVCFGSTARWRPDDTCWDLSASIPALESEPNFQIVVRFKGSADTESYDVPLSREQGAFRAVTYPGSWLYHTSSGRRVNYARGVVLFEKGTIDSVTKVRFLLSRAVEIESIGVAVVYKDGNANNGLPTQRRE